MSSQYDKLWSASPLLKHSVNFRFLFSPPYTGNYKTLSWPSSSGQSLLPLVHFISDCRQIFLNYEFHFAECSTEQNLSITP